MQWLIKNHSFFSPVGKNTICKMLPQLCEATGCPKQTNHSIRYGFAVFCRLFSCVCSVVEYTRIKYQDEWNHKILPGFLLEFCPDTARIFTKMSPDEELVTLVMYSYCNAVLLILQDGQKTVFFWKNMGITRAKRRVKFKPFFAKILPLHWPIMNWPSQLTNALNSH